MAFNNMNSFSTSPFDLHVIESLVRRLQLSSSGDILDATSASDEEEELDSDLSSLSPRQRHRLHVASEEAKLEREIIRIIRSGSATSTLRPNSGQSVTIGEHNICVGNHVDGANEYRVWEWHGHIMIYDDESGFDAEYIYGNYFEKITNQRRKNEVEEEEEEEIEVKEHEENAEITSGLKDLIDRDAKENNSAGRVIHRSSLNAGPKAAK